MIYSISSGCMYKSTLEDFMECASKSGFTSIELMIGNNCVMINQKDIERLCIIYNLKIESVHCPLPFNYGGMFKDASSSLVETVRWANNLGAKVVVTHPYFISDPNDDATRMNETVRYTNDLNNAKKIANPGVHITTENMPVRIHKPVFKTFEDQVDFAIDNDFAFTYDLTHYASWGDSIIDGYHTCKDAVVNIHFSDFLRGKEHVFTGEGELPLKQLLKELKATNYNELLTLELDFTEKVSNLKTKKECLDAMIRAHDFVTFI